MNFANGMKRMADKTLSENSGVVFKSTGGGKLLDLFATIGGMRNQPITEIISKWHAAYKENPEYAANLILYTRSIRDGGIGERKIARALYRELANLEPEKVKRNFQTIVDCGRWDDLFVLEGTPIEDAMWAFIVAQLVEDVNHMKENKPISLLAKWLKSINTSSAESRRIARVFCSKAGLTPRIYRKTLSKLRAYLKVTEVAMSANQWSSIDFETVPSKAMSRYTKTFSKHVPIAFQVYREKLKNGTAKVNAGAISPSEICKKFLISGGIRYWGDGGYGWSWRRTSNANDGRKILDDVDLAQWKALPNYVDEDYEVVVMCDLSGSMSCCNYEPLAASVGLGTYFAQRNKGAYHNLYLSFAGDSHFIQLEDEWDVERCFKEILGSQIAYNTNMDSAFKAVYDLAVETQDTPRAIVIISDGEMDRFITTSQCDSIVSKWEKKFYNAGLEFPRIISWNVACRNGTVIAPSNDNVSYLSGYGAGPMQNLKTFIETSPYEAMIEVLSQVQFTWK